jgi:serine/threonine protein kinase
MPPPATAPEFLDLIQRSGVADEARLKAYVQKLNESGGVPSDPQKFAGLLVRDAVLTYFQAEQLLQGKYKRFTIGKYKVLEKLGAGGMAQVFLCEHKLMRRRVAIKVLPTAKAEDESSLQRFYREARAVAAVDHPNIVRAYDIDQDENLHFLVMEYVDGSNLQDLVKKFGPLDVTRACHYIYGASVGLQHAHEIGLIHRDIKPGNILLDRTGVVKILDMGLARFFHDEDDPLTKKYDENVLGTADYLSPEQALDSHTVDIRADIYSLGATFYYLLTGTPPFPEGSVAQKLIWHQNRQPRPVKSLRPDVPEGVVAVVERMMAKKPENRYQTPAEVMAALAGWVATPIPPPAEREMPQLSPAAGGTGRGPVSMAGVAPPTLVAATAPAAPAAPALPHSTSSGSLTEPGGLRVVPSTSAAPASTPAPAAVANPITGSTPAGPAVWESLDLESDTQSVARGDTDRTGSKTERAPRPRRAAPAADAPRSRRKLYAGLGVLGLVALGAGVYLAFFNKKPQPVPQPPGGEDPARFVVSSKPGENTVPTLREALTRANAGDTIVIAEPRLSEPTLRLNHTRHKDVTIEGVTADGKPPVIEASGDISIMLDIGSVEGLRLRNVEFDGIGKAGVGIQISGPCPGIVLENVTVRGVKSVAVKLQNVSGEDSRLLIDHARIQLTAPTQTAILLSAADRLDTRRVAVKGCRIEGPTGKAAGVGVRIDGPTTDVEIVENRFFNLDAAVSFAKVPAGKTVKAQVNSNTVFGASAGLLFDLSQPAPPTPPEPLGAFALGVNQNYFANTPEIGKAVGAVPTGVAPAHNAFGPGSGAGNVPLALAPLPNPQLPVPPNPADDSKFLRFPSGPPEVTPGKKVGAP